MSQTVQLRRKRPRLTAFQRMKSMLEEWYVCPLCNKLGHLFAANEEVQADGKIWRQYFLSCYDRVPDHLGRENKAKRHHWVPSLQMLRRVDNIEHACNMTLYLSFETKQKDGRVTQKLVQRSDSYLSNFIASLVAQMNGAALNAATSIFANLTAQDITTTAVTARVNSGATGNGLNQFQAATSSGVVALGTAVGTGTTANTVDTPGTAALATPIAKGTGVGQIAYGACTLTAPAVSGSTTSFAVVRPFTNNSGASITITEVGMGAYNGDASLTLFVVRDVLASSVVVTNTSTTTGTYTFSVVTS